MRRIALFLVSRCDSLPAQYAIPDDIRPPTILHRNDLHVHFPPNAEGLGGFAWLAVEVRHQRAGRGYCIYLSTGDLVQGTPVSTIYRGDPVDELANMPGVDAATVVNHEFGYGWKAIRRFARIAHFPLLSTNVQTADDIF